MSIENQSNNFTLPIGTILNGKWVILEFIAKGGMGEIYRAHQLNLKRDVAIKVISKEWLENISDDPDEIENALMRFRQEVRTMVQIRHPNVLQIYDYEKASLKVNDDVFEIEYIVLEYIPGSTLRGTMREEGFYPSEQETKEWLSRYFLPLLEGVKAIHDAGIYHRDIKPENVLMDGEIPKIADFGLARSCKFESMTCSMEIKGTPNYMAPEQFIDFKRTDQRTDIYALGKILYEALAGKIAPNAIPFKKAQLEAPDTPFFKALNNVIKKATDEDIEKRFQSVSELAQAIKDAMATPLNNGHEGVGTEESYDALLKKSFKRQKLLLYSIIIALISILVIATITFFYMRYFMEHETHHIDSVQNNLIQSNIGNATRTFPAVKESRDDVVLHLVPGGELKIPAEFNHGREEVVHISPFYMDENQVTNHQYVNFLNQVLQKIEVKDGAVRSNGKIWLYLGEVMEGYEPIIWEKGRFSIKQSSHSACPVLRVTAFGAMAYAQFYGKRLPTKAEWFFAALGGKQSPPLPALYYQKIELPFPVLMFRKNAYGIRGLNENIGEWVIDSTQPTDSLRNIVIIGGFEKSSLSNHDLPRPISRRPWEAFEEVGFRCVMDIRD